MMDVLITKQNMTWRHGRTYRVNDGVGNLLVERLKIAIDATNDGRIGNAPQVLPRRERPLKVK